jgi:16S rRNA (guanine966-N2)-methyltransferase
MRIIAGKYKSRKIYSSSPAKENCVKGSMSGFRPTTDRAKETLFNVLNNIIDFDGIKVLDLFAGSGSLGFESLSRGAVNCDFVESSAKQIKVIERTAKELGCEENANIHINDALRFLDDISGAEFDLIFADPPYSYENYNQLINGVLKLKFSIFVLEYGTDTGIMYSINDYDIIDKSVGAVKFKIFIKKD